MSEVLVSIATGESVALGAQDAASLTDALWAVSATPGAAGLVGKLRHAGDPGGGVVAVVDHDERTAMRTALDHAPALTPALDDLRAALGPPSTG